MQFILGRKCQKDRGGDGLVPGDITAVSGDTYMSTTKEKDSGA